jgi:hypothetical protein
MSSNYDRQITVAARSKAWTVSARSNTEIVGSNSTRGMNVYMRLFCVCVVLRVGSVPATGWTPVQGVLPIVYKIKKLKKRPRSKGLYSDRQRVITTEKCLMPLTNDAGSSGMDPICRSRIRYAGSVFKGERLVLFTGC